MHCKKCNVELVKDVNWLSYSYKHGSKECADCHRTAARKRMKKTYPRNNKLRMWVDGNYISRKHPLYKPGRYKTFNDAAFSALRKDKEITEGFIYLITNPYFAEKGWYKLGKAVDVVERCNSYQTSSPFRDYYIVAQAAVDQYSKAEAEAKSLAHKVSKTHTIDNNGEWFDADLGDLLVIMDKVGTKYKKDKPVKYYKDLFAYAETGT